MQFNHPLFARTLELLFEFLSSEFIKQKPVISLNGYEYLFSAYLSDITLKQPVTPVAHPVEPLNDYDCVVYPSVGAQHKTDNIAVKPNSVNRLRPVYLQEIIVEITNYDNAIIFENDFPESIDLPIGGHVLRKSNNIRNGKIIWSDD